VGCRDYKVGVAVVVEELLEEVFWCWYVHFGCRLELLEKRSRM
jgi:hypothetical protein